MCKLLRCDHMVRMKQRDFRYGVDYGVKLWLKVCWVSLMLPLAVLGAITCDLVRHDRCHFQVPRRSRSNLIHVEKRSVGLIPSASRSGRANRELIEVFRSIYESSGRRRQLVGAEDRSTEVSGELICRSSFCVTVYTPSRPVSIKFIVPNSRCSSRRSIRTFPPSRIHVPPSPPAACSMGGNAATFPTLRSTSTTAPWTRLFNPRVLASPFIYQIFRDVRSTRDQAFHLPSLFRRVRMSLLFSTLPRSSAFLNDSLPRTRFSVFPFVRGFRYSSNYHSSSDLASSISRSPIIYPPVRVVASSNPPGTTVHFPLEPFIKLSQRRQVNVQLPILNATPWMHPLTPAQRNYRSNSSNPQSDKHDIRVPASV